MFTISLCDDNADEREYIKTLVLDWVERSGESACVREYPSAGAVYYQNTKQA